MQNLTDFFGYIRNTVLSVRPVIDIIDITIVSVMIYYAVKFIRDRRAAKLLIGIFLMAVVYLISDALGMYVLSFALYSIFQVGIISLIILFQPELRSLLEKVGGTSIHSINRIVDQRNIQKVNNSIDIISKAAAEFSAVKRGALIVIERTTKLGDIIKSGILLKAELSAPLLKNIFYDKAPLHDGAVIIGSDLTVEAAGCILPLSVSEDIPADVGTRHRAGLGISENSDAAVIIVSEENGKISVAVDGRLERNFDLYSLKKKLSSLLLDNSNVKNIKHSKNRNRKNKNNNG
ncbi:MAG: diadenylate cyclase CdaA [Oscillospiraceae bacterium]|nr:diadenylate cyclase CdaA [Oscillospiraceae bacterium]